jgi:hypothetical protein
MDYSAPYEIGKKRKFDGESNDHNAESEFIYVLKCERGKYYVGKTSNPVKRLKQHRDGEGALWTSEYRPICFDSLLKSDGAGYDESNATLDAMKKYGIENVRGGAFVQTDLAPSEIEVINKLIRGTSDCCFKCGKNGHFAVDCHVAIEETDKNTKIYLSETKPDYKFRNKNACYRCGYDSHFLEDCDAFRDINGKILDPNSRKNCYSGPFQNLSRKFTPISCTRCSREGHTVSSCYAVCDKFRNPLPSLDGRTGKKSQSVPQHSSYNSHSSSGSFHANDHYTKKNYHYPKKYRPYY